jgi:hypothetical protein
LIEAMNARIGKRLLQHDLLALSLACVVSLLFAKNISEFLNTTGKKHDRYQVSIPTPIQGFSEEQQAFLIPASLQSPAENLIFSYSPRVRAIHTPIAFARILGILATTTSSGRDYPDQDEYYRRAAGLGSSISITQRKLII